MAEPWSEAKCPRTTSVSALRCPFYRQERDMWKIKHGSIIFAKLLKRDFGSASERVYLGVFNLCFASLTPVARSNLLPEKVFDSPNFSSEFFIRIPFYCVHSWGCGVDS